MEILHYSSPRVVVYNITEEECTRHQVQPVETVSVRDLPGGPVATDPPAGVGTWVQSLVQGRSQMPWSNKV